MCHSAITLLLCLTLLTGAAYPLLITGVAHLLVPARAQGSLIQRNGTTIGSRLIGQSFTSPQYFWSRPSATTTEPYNALASGGSNVGPLNPALISAVTARINALHLADPDTHQPVPVDLVTASASGLDPEISVAAAQYQATRVARARGMTLSAVQQLIAAQASSRWLGYFGEPRVNVLQLNLALDAIPPN